MKQLLTRGKSSEFSLATMIMLNRGATGQTIEREVTLSISVNTTGIGLAWVVLKVGITQVAWQLRVSIQNRSVQSCFHSICHLPADITEKTAITLTSMVTKTILLIMTNRSISIERIGHAGYCCLVTLITKTAGLCS